VSLGFHSSFVPDDSYPPRAKKQGVDWCIVRGNSDLPWGKEQGDD